MRPVRDITEIENARVEPMGDDFPANVMTLKREPVEPEPVGTIVLTPFRIEGYARDSDGSLLAQLAAVDSEGATTGWREAGVGLYPDTKLVVSQEELAGLFRAGIPAAETGLLPCPSCLLGADPPAQVHYGIDTVPARWIIYCSACSHNVEADTPEAARAEWNTRLGVPLDPAAAAAPPVEVPRRLLVRFMRYLEAHPSWGSLHAVLDDGNMEDHWVESAVLHAEREDDREGAELAEVLLLMNAAQRRVVSKLEAQGGW